MLLYLLMLCYQISHKYIIYSLSLFLSLSLSPPPPPPLSLSLSLSPSLSLSLPPPHTLKQAQRLKTIKQLHDQYKKGMDELEKCHRKQQVDMQTEIKKEMALLQKKMLMESVSQHNVAFESTVCPSRDELGVLKNVHFCIIHTKQPFYMYYMG